MVEFDPLGNAVNHRVIDRATVYPDESTQYFPLPQHGEYSRTWRAIPLHSFYSGPREPPFPPGSFPPPPPLIFCTFTRKRTKGRSFTDTHVKLFHPRENRRHSIRGCGRLLSRRYISHTVNRVGMDVCYPRVSTRA